MNHLWLDKIITCKLLSLYGMSHLYSQVPNVNGIWLQQTVKLRTCDIYRQRLSQEMYESPACLEYWVMTVEGKPHNYLCVVP